MIDSSFHKSNRRKLSKVLDGGIIVLSAHGLMQSSNDGTFKFKQEPNFWWLTGINQPGWMLIIDGSTNREWLVKPNISDVDLIFNGGLASDIASQISGVADAIERSNLGDLLTELAVKSDCVYTIHMPEEFSHSEVYVNPAIGDLAKLLQLHFSNVKDCQPDLVKLRAIKQPVEIAALKDSIDLTVRAFEHIKPLLSSFDYEYQIEAEFSYFFRKNGAVGHAYEPIVASGNNACTLHYEANNDRLIKGQMVLLDIGALSGMYGADISRTYALGDVSNRQKQIHNAVTGAHRQIVGLLKPGLNVADYHRQVDEIMTQVVEELGLGNGIDACRKYFPHAISHGLGLDTHDALGRPECFLPGMVLTVEPGIYIPSEGIGVRIEDDILITDTSHINLSADLSIDL